MIIFQTQEEFARAVMEVLHAHLEVVVQCSSPDSSDAGGVTVTLQENTTYGRISIDYDSDRP